MFDPDKISRTWDVSKASAAKIADLSDAQCIGHSELVDFLLSFALNELSSGRLVLRLKPVKYVVVAGPIEEA